MIEQTKNKSIFINNSLMTCNYMITNRSKDNSLVKIFNTLNDEIKKNENVIYRRVHTDTSSKLNNRVTNTKLNYRLNFNNKLYIASTRYHVTPKKELKSEIIKERPNIVKLSFSAKLNVTSRNDEKMRYNTTFSNKKSNMRLNIKLMKDITNERKDRAFDNKPKSSNKITNTKYIKKSNFKNYMKAKVNLTSPNRLITFSNNTVETVPSENNICSSKVRINNLSNQIRTPSFKFNISNNNMYKYKTKNK